MIDDPVFTLPSLIEPGRVLHLFGPAAEVVAKDLSAEAVVAGWAPVQWAGCGEAFPETAAWTRSLVKVPVFFKDYGFWTEAFASLKARLWETRGTALLGVSVDEHVPKAWKFYAAVRVECHTAWHVTVVKTLLDRRQGRSYIRAQGGTWEPKLDVDVSDPEFDEMLQKIEQG